MKSPKPESQLSRVDQPERSPSRAARRMNADEGDARESFRAAMIIPTACEKVTSPALTKPMTVRMRED